MRSSGRSLIMLALAVLPAATAHLSAQTLNPIVTVLPRPTSAVPAECEEGLSPAPAPRISPEEVRAATPQPPPPAPAPRAPIPVSPSPTPVSPAPSLRGGLREVQDAAERGDRDGFRDALARAHALAASEARGGEKAAAEDVLKIYDDLQVIWDYQFDSRTGAFFDASTDNLLTTLRAYPEYQRFIADQTIVDASGTRFYPTGETRAFLVREAMTRLRRMGIAAATRPTATPAAAPAPAPAPRPPAVAAAKPGATKKPPVKAATSAERPKKRPAAATSVGHPPKKSPTKTATSGARPPKTSTTKTATRVERHPKISPTKTSPVAATTPVERGRPTMTVPSTGEGAGAQPKQTPTAIPGLPPPVTTSTAEMTSSAPSTTASATATATATTSGEPERASQRSESRRSLILPLILIVVGVGVLILLFRTSS